MTVVRLGDDPDSHPVAVVCVIVVDDVSLFGGAFLIVLIELEEGVVGFGAVFFLGL